MVEWKFGNDSKLINLSLVEPFFNTRLGRVRGNNVHTAPETELNALSAKPIKWPNTLKQFVGKSRWIVWVCFDYFVGLALKGLITFFSSIWFTCHCKSGFDLTFQKWFVRQKKDSLFIFRQKKLSRKALQCLL